VAQLDAQYIPTGSQHHDFFVVSGDTVDEDGVSALMMAASEGGAEACEVRVGHRKMGMKGCVDPPAILM
jgi:hypothetical protein